MASPKAMMGRPTGLGPLLSEAAWFAALKQLHLYADHARSSYLECRLGRDDDQRVDLLLSLLPPRRVAHANAPRGACSLVDRLLHAWRDSGSALARAPVAWLELDHLGDVRAPQPNLCVCLAPGYARPLSPVAACEPEAALAAAAEGLRVVGRRAPRANRRTLEVLFNELPRGAAWIHFSIMWTRRPAQLKLYGAFPEASLMDFLIAQRWAGDFRQLERVLRRHCPTERTGGMLYVDLPLSDMRRAGRAGLGISFSQQQLRQARERDTARTALLDELCADNVCTLERARAARAWLAPTSASPGAHRWLDVKLVLSQKRLTAKAYLGTSGPSLTGDFS